MNSGVSDRQELRTAGPPGSQVKRRSKQPANNLETTERWAPRTFGMYACASLFLTAVLSNS